MTEHFVRDGDILTVTMILEDQVYWQPLIRSASFQLDAAMRVLAGTMRAAGGDPARVRGGAALPAGRNPYLSEFAKLYNLPMEAAGGGAATTYPE